MKQHLCPVVENCTLWSNVRMLTFDAPDLARLMRPGQVALVRDPARVDPYLRRMASLYEIAGGQVRLMFPPGDLLASRARLGATLDLLAPVGIPVEFDPDTRHVLLIAEGSHVAPLISIARNAVEQRHAVVLLVRATGTEPLFPAYLLPPEVEYRADGDAPEAELIHWADRIIANGSMQLYRDLAGWVREARYRLEPGLAQVLLHLPMPCGTGDCYACAVETARGVRRACADGPAFDLAELQM